MILLTNKTLQYLIYNQLYSAGVYELLATQAPTEILQTQMKLFQQDSLNNASYLDRYYQELNTSSYNPIVREPVNHGSFKKNVYWMLEYEGTNTCIFVDESFNGQMMPLLNLLQLIFLLQLIDVIQNLQIFI